MSAAAAAGQRRIGPILLAPGVTPLQVFLFMAVVLSATFVDRFVTNMQPLILVQQLGVARGGQGVLMGSLSIVQQIGLLLFIGLAGVLADAVGRKWVLATTLIGFLACLLIYPLIGAIWMLFALRFVWGVSFTGWAVGGATKVMDFPDNRSRGKMLTLVLICNAGLGALFLWKIGGPLPKYLISAGLSAPDASRVAFWIMAAVALAGALIAIFLLAPDRPAAAVKTSHGKGLRALLANVAEILRTARHNPRLALVLIIGCIIRTDGVIMQSFLGLWVVNAAQDKGVPLATATATYALFTAIMMGASFVSPLIFGMLADKVDRAVLLVCSLVLTSIAFLSFGLIPDVFGPAMIGLIVFVGLAEGAVLISAQSLLAEEAPEHLRGSTQGALTFVGVFSLIGVNWIGGHLFDKVAYAAPFVMEGMLHTLFLVIGAVLLFRTLAHGRARKAAAAASGV